MDEKLIQHLVYQAAKTATKQAMEGNPISDIIWMAPRTGTDNWCGHLITIGGGAPVTATETAWWDRK